MQPVARPSDGLKISDQLEPVGRKRIVLHEVSASRYGLNVMPQLVKGVDAENIAFSRK
jgi:hypothetical protein